MNWPESYGALGETWHEYSIGNSSAVERSSVEILYVDFSVAGENTSEYIGWEWSTESGQRLVDEGCTTIIVTNM